MSRFLIGCVQITWKNVPQDAVGIVEWWRRQNVIHATGSSNSSQTAIWMR